MSADMAALAEMTTCETLRDSGVLDSEFDYAVNRYGIENVSESLAELNPDAAQYFHARRKVLAAEKKAEADARAAQLAELTVTIAANAGEEGKLFGSIGTRDIADAVTAAGVAIEKSEVRLPDGALRNVGEFDVVVQLHTDVETTVKLVVVAG